MVVPKVVCVVALCFTARALGALQSSRVEQSPRQAVREMLSGDEEAFKKHLTLDMQAKINEQIKTAAAGSPIRSISSLKAAHQQGLESFETGPVLFSFNNAQAHERLEIRVDGDDLHGDEDEMELSLHAFRNGVELDLPVGFRLRLNWQAQQGIWRLTAMTVSASIPLGDPRILDKSWWNPPAIASLGAGVAPATSVAAVEDRAHPKMLAARSVRLIGLAENLYVQKHPEMGFTCSLAELVEIGKGFDDDGAYKFMSPEFAEGTYNGYRFALSGCTGKAPKAFQVIAEPVNGKGRAYCSDQTRDLRASEDGRGATCLATGKFVRQ